MLIRWWLQRYGRIGASILLGLVLLVALVWAVAGRAASPDGAALANQAAVPGDPGVQAVALRGAVLPAVHGVPALTVETPLTMPVTLQLTPDEQQALRLVEWLPITSTHTVTVDRELAQALAAALNANRTTPLVLDPALTARAEQMALSKLTWRLYDEGGQVWAAKQERWLRTFGVLPGGPLSLDMLVLPADYIAAANDPAQLQALMAESGLGVMQPWPTHMGMGVARVDGWDTGGALVILFY